MAKGSGNTRTVSSSTAAATRTLSNAAAGKKVTNARLNVFAAYNAQLDMQKNEALAGGLPKPGDSKNIKVGSDAYTLSVSKEGTGKYVVNIKRDSDGYSQLHEAYYTGTKTPANAKSRGDVSKAVKKEIKDLFDAKKK